MPGDEVPFLLRAVEGTTTSRTLVLGVPTRFFHIHLPVDYLWDIQSKILLQEFVVSLDDLF